jgi:hypothetical protein
LPALFPLLQAAAATATIVRETAQPWNLFTTHSSWVWPREGAAEGVRSVLGRVE